MRSRLASASAAVCAGALLAACGQPAGEENAADTAAPGISDETLAALDRALPQTDEPEGEELVSFAVPAEVLITAEGVGPARVGETLGALSAAMGDFPVRLERGYAPGLSAVCFDEVENGPELLCAAFASSNEPSEQVVVTMLVTRHPRFRTSEGVGPGVTLDDAADVYGPALLYIGANDGAEYVDFDLGPVGSIAFQAFLPAAPRLRAGLYDEDEEIEETEEYRPGAIIGAVEVADSLSGRP